MSQQVIEQNAHVRITADASGFQQATGAATQSINPLIAGIALVPNAWDKALNASSARLKAFRADSAAQFAGVTQAAAAYNQQLSAIHGSLGASGRSNLAPAYGTQSQAIASRLKDVSQGEVVALMTQAAKSGLAPNAATGRVTTAVKMGQATGEDAGSLMSGMRNLERTMGAAKLPTDQLADTITGLSSKIGTAASGVTNFAQAIAPIASTIGMTTKEVLGFSAAFAKAGQDSASAATVFTKLAQNISISDRYGKGGQELAAAAKMDETSFNNLDSTQKIMAITSNLAKGGPEALNTLDKLGLDGPRSVRAIQGMASSGSLQQAIALASGDHSGAVEAGSAEASSGLTGSRLRLQNQFTELGQHAGAQFEPTMAAFTDLLSEIVKAGTPLAKMLIDLTAPLKPLLAVLTGATKLMGIGGLAGGAAMALSVGKSGTATGLALGAVGGHVDRLPPQMRQNVRAAMAGKVRDNGWIGGVRNSAQVLGMSEEDLLAMGLKDHENPIKRMTIRESLKAAKADALAESGGRTLKGPKRFVHQAVGLGQLAATESVAMARDIAADATTPVEQRSETNRSRSGWISRSGELTLGRVLAGTKAHPIKDAASLAGGAVRANLSVAKGGLNAVRSVAPLVSDLSAHTDRDALPSGATVRNVNEAIDSVIPRAMRADFGIPEQVTRYSEMEAAKKAMDDWDGGPLPKTQTDKPDAAADDGPGEPVDRLISVFERAVDAVSRFIDTLDDASGHTETRNAAEAHAAAATTDAANDEVDAEARAAEATARYAESAAAAKAVLDDVARQAPAAPQTGVAPTPTGDLTGPGEGPGLTPVAGKKFGFRALGSVAMLAGAQAAPHLPGGVGQAVQGAMQGAGAGMMLGPWGALAGAGIGLAGSAWNANKESNANKASFLDSVSTREIETPLEKLGVAFGQAADDMNSVAKKLRATYEALPEPRSAEDALDVDRAEFKYARSSGYELRTPGLQPKDINGENRDLEFNEALNMLANATLSIEDPKLLADTVHDVTSLMSSDTDWAAFNAAKKQIGAGEYTINSFADVDSASKNHRAVIESEVQNIMDRTDTMTTESEQQEYLGNELANLYNAERSGMSGEAAGYARDAILTNAAGLFDLDKDQQDVLRSLTQDTALKATADKSLAQDARGKWTVKEGLRGAPLAEATQAAAKLNALVDDGAGGLVASILEGDRDILAGNRKVDASRQQMLANSGTFMGSLAYRQADEHNDPTGQFGLNVAPGGAARANYTGQAIHTATEERFGLNESSNLKAIWAMAADAKEAGMGLNEMTADFAKMAAMAGTTEQALQLLARAATAAVAAEQGRADVRSGASQQGGYLDPSVKAEFQDAVHEYAIDRSDENYERLNSARNGFYDAVNQNVGAEQQMERTLRSQERQRGYDWEDYSKSEGRTRESHTREKGRSDEDFARSKSRAREDYDRQRRYADDDFAKNRSRQEADNAKSIQRALDDYNKSRSRAEADNTKSVQRALDDYNKNRTRQEADFNKGRRRAEEDFNRQKLRLAENTAKQMFDVQNRLQAKPTWSASGMVTNLSEKVAHFKKQLADIKKLRALGLSDDAIKQLGLTDPEMAQQVARLVQDLESNRGQITELNTLATQMIDVGSQFATHDLNDSWQDTLFQYEQGLARSLEDYNESMSRQADDFGESMKRQADDFQEAMQRQADDFQETMRRQADDYTEMMRRQDDDFFESRRRQDDEFARSNARQEEDYNRSWTQRTADMERQLAEQAQDLRDAHARQTTEFEKQYEVIDGLSEKHLKELNGDAAKYAQGLVDSNAVALDQIDAVMEALKNDTPRLFTVLNGEFTAFQKTLMDLFPGIEFTVNNVSGQGGRAGTQYVAARADGGVLDGYSPGLDNHVFTSPTGGTLLLSGGEGIMRPEWVKAVGGAAAVDQMNQDAKFGRFQAFAEGGVFDASKIQKAIDFAASKLGMPYQWGGAGNPSFDCSGLTQAAYAYAGLPSLPHLSAAQGRMGKRVASPVPGDLVLWDNSTRNVGADHVGLYAGGGQVIEAVQPKIRRGGVWGRPWFQRIVEGGAQLGDAYTGSTSGAEWGIMSPTELKTASKFASESLETIIDKMTANPGTSKIAPSTSGALRSYIEDKTSTELPARPLAEGAIFDRKTFMMGEAGPEILIPLNERGSDFLVDTLVKMSALDIPVRGSEIVTSGGGGECGHMTNQTYDSSVNINGQITVQAQDPNGMARMLEQKARMKRLVTR